MKFNYRFKLLFFLLLVLAQFLFWLVIGIYNIKRVENNQIASRIKLVQTLHLTDYCISTESRHTRHFSQPEVLAPFQDFPGFYDHTPSSSFYLLPESMIFKLFLQNRFELSIK